MTWTVLHHACEHLDSRCIIERCKSSANELLEVDDHGSTPLHILAWGNPSPDLLKALVDCCPAALSDQDVHGDTCLHVACSFPGTDVKVVQILIDACPGLVGIKNKEGLMPLHITCRYSPENKAVISCLVEAYPSALLKPIKVGNLRYKLHSCRPLYILLKSDFPFCGCVVVLTTTVSIVNLTDGRPGTKTQEQDEKSRPSFCVP